APRARLARRTRGRAPLDLRRGELWQPGASARPAATYVQPSSFPFFSERSGTPGGAIDYRNAYEAATPNTPLPPPSVEELLPPNSYPAVSPRFRVSHRPTGRDPRTGLAAL